MNNRSLCLFGQLGGRLSLPDLQGGHGAGHLGVGRNRLNDKGVARDHRVGADHRGAAQHRGVGIDHHIVLNGGMALFSAELLALAGG